MECLINSLRTKFAFHLNICEKSTIVVDDDFHKGLNEGRIDALKSCIDDIDKIIDECNNKKREDFNTSPLSIDFTLSSSDL